MCLQKSLKCWLHDCAKFLKLLFVSGSLTARNFLKYISSTLFFCDTFNVHTYFENKMIKRSNEMDTTEDIWSIVLNSVVP